MSSLTGLLYGALVIYLGGWYLGRWTGNFSLLLFILTLVTFGYWLAERFVFAPRRLAAAANLEQQDAIRRRDLARQGIAKIDGDGERVDGVGVLARVAVASLERGGERADDGAVGLGGAAALLLEVAQDARERRLALRQPARSGKSVHDRRRSVPRHPTGYSAPRRKS